MGGHDCYCAFCGAALYNPIFDHDDPNDEEYTYDRAVIKKEDAEWLSDCRMLGYNVNSPSTERVYMTGKAYNYEDLGGSLECEPSNDASFPTSDQGDHNYIDDRINLDCYKHEEAQLETFPFHWACYSLFSRVLQWTNPCESGVTGEIDREVLYRCFKTLYDGQEYGDCLTEIDYGTISNQMDQYWCTSRGSEYFALNPLQVPGLHDICNGLPRLPQSVDRVPIARSLPIVTGKDVHPDSFSVLPAEIVLRIMLLLPTESLVALRASSRATACLELGKGFWISHMRRHLPWLYDLPLDTIEDPERVAWSQVHKFLLHVTDEQNPAKELALANRRRFFGVCQQIAEEYWKQEAALRRENEMLNSKLEGTIISTRMSRIASDRLKYRGFNGWTLFHKDGTEHTINAQIRFSLQAINDWSDVGSAPLHIRLLWGDHQFLAAIHTALMSSTGCPRKQMIHGAITDARDGMDETIVVAEGFWITSVELVLKTTDRGRGTVGMKFNLQPSGTIQVGSPIGDLRILEVRQSYTFLGFQGELYGDHITRLALLQGQPSQPTPSLAPYSAKEALRENNLGKYVWAHELPSRNLLAGHVEIGYWTEADESSLFDFEPMEALILGLTDSELSSVIAISGDVLLGGFAVHYSDCKRRAIGPRHHAMKQFSIAGSQGERIVGMGTGVGNLPHTIIFQTNWGRQCIFGPRQNGRPQQPKTITTAGHMFVGFYAGWMYRDQQLTSCAILSGPTDDTRSSAYPNVDQWDCDEQGRLWDMGSLPANWTASGLIWGNNQDQVEADAGGNHRIISDPRIVSWLDLSKVVDTIEIWFTHPLRMSPVSPYTGFGELRPAFEASQCMEVQFVSLILRYSDGTIAASGPREFDDSYKHEDDTESVCGCQCALAWQSRAKEPWKKPHAKLHYRCEKWQAQGKRVTELRIWSSVLVEGLQFVNEDGASSPIFGYGEEDEPTGTIKFGDAEAVGLKLFSDGNRRPVYSQDIVIMGVQGVYRDVW